MSDFYSDLSQFQQESEIGAGLELLRLFSGHKEPGVEGPEQLGRVIAHLQDAAFAKGQHWRHAGLLVVLHDALFASLTLAR